MIAILAPQHEVRTHAATIPFLFQELRDARVHTVLNSYQERVKAAKVGRVI